MRDEILLFLRAALQQLRVEDPAVMGILMYRELFQLITVRRWLRRVARRNTDCGDEALLGEAWNYLSLIIDALCLLIILQPRPRSDFDCALCAAITTISIRISKLLIRI